MRLPACLLVVLSLAGCATLPRPPAVDWDGRQQAFGSRSQWRMSGRVAVAVDGTGGTASLDWQQGGGISALTLTGPFGAGVLKATHGPGGLRLEDGAGTALEGGPAEAALEERLGTGLPIAALRYWVLGAPAPGQPYFDVSEPGAGPQAFEQGGWRVSVARWEPVADGVDLPVRLSAERDGTRLRLAINRWELGP